MKMSDVFKPYNVIGNLIGDYRVTPDSDESPCLAVEDGGYYAIFNRIEHAKAAALAINNHDKLVDAANKLLVFVDAMQIIANRDCSHAEKVKRLNDGLKDHMLPYADELSAILKELDQ